MEFNNDKNELEYLRKEIERIRKERDTYRDEIECQSAKVEKQTSAELKVLSAQLSKEIREDFFGSVSRVIWIMGILIGVATAGGFWKLSDIITNRINEKVDEREGEIRKLRDQVMDTLVDFKIQATTAVKEVSEHRRAVERESESAIANIRSKTLAIIEEIDTNGTATVSLVQSGDLGKINDFNYAQEGEAWFGKLPSNFIAIAGSRFHQTGADITISENKHMGAFSHYFQKALFEPNADTDYDLKVSLVEAVRFTGLSLKQSSYSQEPIIVGEKKNIPLFALHKLSKAEKPLGVIYALLVGINKVEGFGSSLQGAVSDVLEFKKLLENDNYLLASKASIHILTDNNATTSNIQNEINWLQQQATPQDKVLFYYSGHITQVQDKAGRSATGTIKVLVPYNFDFNKQNYVGVPDLIQDLDKINTQQKMVIIDG